ncbi:hypothetical protein [Streptomyces sp. NPDC058657]|uniref:hypothetical protein n=1 Tax=unclassified Streptomyces TaxID=2593676 RepID=UPI003652B4B4
MKKHTLILTAAAAVALASSAGAAAADEIPLGLPLVVPQVADGSFEGADRLVDHGIPVPAGATAR